MGSQTNNPKVTCKDHPYTLLCIVPHPSLSCPLVLLLWCPIVIGVALWSMWLDAGMDVGGIVDVAWLMWHVIDVMWLMGWLHCQHEREVSPGFHQIIFQSGYTSLFLGRYMQITNTIIQV